MKLAVIGAHGKVGSLLCKRANGTFDVTAFVRSPAEFDEGINVSLDIDITNTPLSKITEALKGFDAVVFTAGAGGKGLDLTLSVDLDGAVKVAEAVQANGIKRFILVSALKTFEREFWWDSFLRSYYIAKKYADEVIIKMDVNYTILQPGMLVDTAGTGKIMDPTKVDAYADEITMKQSDKLSIPRDDVAHAIVECLNNDATIRKIIPLISGGIQIKDALALVS